MSTSFNGYRTA